MFSKADLVVLWRAALAAVLGLAIGWERRATGSAIRARTIGLAALTAASLTALGHEIFAIGTDRIVQGIVTGIGFLGAGVIIHGAGGEVRGLTTAASMWAMTGIGVAVGSGHELLGIHSTTANHPYRHPAISLRQNRHWMEKVSDEHLVSCRAQLRTLY